MSSYSAERGPRRDRRGALGQRPATASRDSLVRVRSENQRLPRLVDDLLWLARSTPQRSAPGDEPVDVARLAAGCAERFRAVGTEITVEGGGRATLMDPPPEWIDRLTGVLMDNA